MTIDLSTMYSLRTQMPDMTTTQTKTPHEEGIDFGDWQSAFRTLLGAMDYNQMLEIAIMTQSIMIKVYGSNEDRTTLSQIITEALHNAVRKEQEEQKEVKQTISGTTEKEALERTIVTTSGERSSDSAPPQSIREHIVSEMVSAYFVVMESDNFGVHSAMTAAFDAIHPFAAVVERDDFNTANFHSRDRYIGGMRDLTEEHRP